MKVFASGCLAAAVVLLGPSALAHHSFAMFDRTKPTTLEGVVKEFQWTSPHIWIQVMVPDGKGGEKEWSIEGGAPGPMARSGGWNGRTIKPGDKVTVVISPLRDGAAGGSLVRITLPGGKVMGMGPSTSAPPQAPPAAG